MKRSELINHIAFVINAPRIENDSRTVAADIVSLLEHKGILPPFNPDVMHVQMAAVTPGQSAEESKPIRGWDEE